MKMYSEQDIKNYFNYLMKEYPNSNCYRQAEAMLFRMFDTKYDDQDTLKKVIEKINKSDI